MKIWKISILILILLLSFLKIKQFSDRYINFDGNDIVGGEPRPMLNAEPIIIPPILSAHLQCLYPSPHHLEYIPKLLHVTKHFLPPAS